MRPRIDWLIARPVAHRGLHDVSSNIIENTPSAVQAAVAAGYAIEVDLQVTADGEAVVHHDDELGRLTDGEGRIRELAAAELKRVPFKSSADRILTLGELCDLVAGRVALILELKSRFDTDRRLALRVQEVLRAYPGPVAVMSFDAYPIRVLREVAPQLPRGIVTEKHRPATDALLNRGITRLRQTIAARPHFLAYAVRDLPAGGALVAMHGLGLAILAWTLHSAQDWRKARRWADQMIFEGFKP